jgi:hypothetical protein
MAIVLSYGGPASLSVFPENPRTGVDADVQAAFSGSVYNDGKQTETVTYSWSITGEVYGSNYYDVPVGPGETFSASTTNVYGSFQAPVESKLENARFSITWNGDTVCSGSGYIYVDLRS